MPVHERDIKRWALIKAKQLNIKFKASRKFILNLKRKFEIVGRKVTKYVSKKSLQLNNDKGLMIGNFRTNAMQEIQNYGNDYILNSDQTGFQYESISKRTLAKKGQKVVLLSIELMNATTHSFTIEPTITLPGKCFNVLHYSYV